MLGLEYAQTTLFFMSKVTWKAYKTQVQARGQIHHCRAILNVESSWKVPKIKTKKKKLMLSLSFTF